MIISKSLGWTTLHRAAPTLGAAQCQRDAETPTSREVLDVVPKLLGLT